MKLCNINRDKNYGSKMLFKKTGIVCGAREGSSNVNEPVLKQRLQSSSGCHRRSKTSTNVSKIYQTIDVNLLDDDLLSTDAGDEEVLLIQNT
jgi:hypothetical protein